MIEVGLHFESRPPLFPPRAGVVCCGGEVMPSREAGPMRSYQCSGCGTKYALLVKPERRSA